MKKAKREKGRTIGVRMGADLVRLLDDVAGKRRWSRGQVMRVALVEMIDREGVR